MMLNNDVPPYASLIDPNNNGECVLSVITVCLNSERYIGRCIQSVVSQKDPRVEYIIWDGGSSDETLSIARAVQFGIDRIINGKDKGIYDAMNKASLMAKGQFIIFLNSDDYFIPDVLPAVCGILEVADSGSIFYADWFTRRSDDSFRVRCARHNSVFIHTLCHQACFMPSWLVKRGFSDKFHICADFYMMNNVIHHNCRYFKLNFPTTVMQSGGVSGQRKWRSIFESGVVVLRRRQPWLAIAFIAANILATIILLARPWIGGRVQSPN